MQEWRCQRCGDAMFSSVIPDDLLCGACDEFLEWAADHPELAADHPGGWPSPQLEVTGDG
jgi:hypothetical protein